MRFKSLFVLTLLVAFAALLILSGHNFQISEIISPAAEREKDQLPEIKSVVVESQPLDKYKSELNIKNNDYIRIWGKGTITYHTANVKAIELYIKKEEKNTGFQLAGKLEGNQDEWQFIIDTGDSKVHWRIYAVAYNNKGKVQSDVTDIFNTYIDIVYKDNIINPGDLHFTAPPGQPAKILEKTPPGFCGIAWLDENRIFGKFKYGAVIYDVSSGEYENLYLEDAYHLQVSPDRQKVLYHDKEKLSIYSIKEKKKETREIPEIAENAVFTKALWAYDSKRLLLEYTGKWHVFYYIYTLANASMKSMGNQFTGTAWYWNAENKIFFTCGDPGGRGEGSIYTDAGYEQDLAFYDFQKNAYRLITRADPRTLYNFLGWKNKTSLYAVKYQRENGGLRSKSYRVLNTETGEETDANFKMEYDRIYGNKRGTNLIGIKEIEKKGMGGRCAIYSLDKGEKLLLEIPYHEDLPSVIWSPGGKKAALNFKVCLRDEDGRMVVREITCIIKI